MRGGISNGTGLGVMRGLSFPTPNSKPSFPGHPSAQLSFPGPSASPLSFNGPPTSQSAYTSPPNSQPSFTGPPTSQSSFTGSQYPWSGAQGTPYPNMYQYPGYNGGYQPTDKFFPAVFPPRANHSGANIPNLTRPEAAGLDRTRSEGSHQSRSKSSERSLIRLNSDKQGRNTIYKLEKNYPFYLGFNCIFDIFIIS